VTFVSPRDKGILLKTCENGKQGDAICGFEVACTPLVGGRCLQAAVGLLCKVDELHVVKAESAPGTPRVSDGHESGFGK
jgi:hypothetical protein